MPESAEIDPDYVSAHDCLGEGYLAKGMFDQAVVEFLRAARGEPVRTVGLAQPMESWERETWLKKVLAD